MTWILFFKYFSGFPLGSRGNGNSKDGWKSPVCVYHCVATAGTAPGLRWALEHLLSEWKFWVIWVPAHFAVLFIFPSHSGLLQVQKTRQACALLNVTWQPGWEGSWGRMHTCVWMAESLRCSPETITTLLTGWTPIQNKKFKRKTKTIKELHKVSLTSATKAKII